MKDIYDQEFDEFQNKINLAGLKESETPYFRKVRDQRKTANNTTTENYSTLNIDGVDFAGLSKENEELKKAIQIQSNKLNN